MNIKKIIVTILIDILAIAALVLGIYLLMAKELSEWQSNLATALVVISLPVIFYSVFTMFAFNKYGKLKAEDDKLWEEASEEEQEAR